MEFFKLNPRLFYFQLSHGFYLPTKWAVTPDISCLAHFKPQSILTFAQDMLSV
jgi:hypothetical protein